MDSEYHMLKSFRFWCFAAALISLTLSVLHVVGGGPVFHEPALQSALPETWKVAFSTIWHEVSALLFLNGVFLTCAGLALRKNHLLLWFVLMLNMAFGLLFFGYGIARLNTPWLLAQWVIFAAISTCTALSIVMRDSLRVVEEVAARPDHYTILPAASFADTYIVHDADFSNAIDVARVAFGKAPAWVDGLMCLRNIIVRPFGLITKPQDANPNHIGIFPVLLNTNDRVVMGLDDKHLDFRVVVELFNAGRSVSLTTLVQPHHIFGNAYLTVIMPFHRIIVATMLAQAAKG
jgi:hypothetical protein